MARLGSISARTAARPRTVTVAVLVAALVTSLLTLSVGARTVRPRLASSGSTGYYLVSNSGGVFPFGAPFYGSVGGLLNQPVVGIASAPAGGYWLAAADGGVFSYGAAGFQGSMGGTPLNRPVVGIKATPDGNGYWLVASDGGIFSFGDARFYGSTGGMALNQPVVGMEATPDGRGYWLVASDGGIFSFGDARFYGSTGATVLNEAVTAMASSPDGRGYWLVAADGGIFAFGDAPFRGSAASLGVHAPVVGLASGTGGDGYWLAGGDGGIFTYGALSFFGAIGDSAGIVGIAANNGPNTGGITGPGTLATPPGYSPSQLSFQDTFPGQGLNSAYWNAGITSIAGGPWNASSWGGVAYSADNGPGGKANDAYAASQVIVNNALVLSAVPSGADPGYGYVSGAVNTYGKVGWSGGYFQARVKMPDMTSGYWPALWFLPAAGAGTGGDTGEFDVYEGGENTLGQPNATSAATLHTFGNSTELARVGDLTSGFHTIGAQYVPGVSLTVYIDGDQVAQFTQDVPNWPLQLIMDLDVGNWQTSGWHTVGNPPPASMVVSEVQFYS